MKISREASIGEWRSHLARIQVAERRRFVRAGLEAMRSATRPGSDADTALQLAQTAVESTETLGAALHLLTRFQRGLMLEADSYDDGRFDVVFLARLILINIMGITLYEPKGNPSYLG